MEEKKIETVYSGVREAVKGQKEFLMSLAGVGAFPSMKRIQVVWTGIFTGAEEASALRDKVEDYMLKEGFEKERNKFVPHITIGRVRSGKSIHRLAKLMEEIPFASDEFKANSISVIKSDLTPEGPIYTTLLEVSFG